MRTFFRIKYVQNDITDSPYYAMAAKIIVREIMRKFSTESVDEANDSWGEIVVASKEQLNIEEMKSIVCYLWESIINNAYGSYNGFKYKDLRPESFVVSIEEEEELETAEEIAKISDKILACFSIQDMNRIYNKYDSRSQYIENHIKTVADCI